MKKTNKIIIATISVVVVLSLAILIGQSTLFQGRLNLVLPKQQKQDQNIIDPSRIFLYKNNVVSVITSPVTSAVPSVVVSEITSVQGTSKVASVVVSGVVSPVASAVVLPRGSQEQFNKLQLKLLTKEILEKIAQEDYKNNKEKFDKEGEEYFKEHPEEFTLSDEERDELLKLYESNNKKSSSIPIKNLRIR